MVPNVPSQSKITWQQLRRRSRVVWRLLVLAAGIALGSTLGGVLIPARTPRASEDSSPPISYLADPPGRSQTLLLLGLDQEKLDAKTKTPAQVQLLLLARVHPSGALELLQIPSDLTVLLPGQTKLQPLANLYGQGGVALIADVVAQLLANGGEPLQPDRYLLLSRDGLRTAINGIGGLPFNIENSIRYQDKAGKLKIQLDAGQQWLGGSEVDQFLRFKGPYPGEGGRRQRQQQLVLPLADRLADPSVASSLPALLQNLRRKIDTNLSQGEALSLLAAGLKNPDLIQISRLPLSQTPGPIRLDQLQAEPLLEIWHQNQPPALPNPQVSIEGAETDSTSRALDKLLAAGIRAQISFSNGELPRLRTLIIHGRNPQQAQAVRKILGVGELQRGPLSPGAGVSVLLGKDWRHGKP
jgi:LCP family protein required for cell wall assembly